MWHLNCGSYRWPKHFVGHLAYYEGLSLSPYYRYHKFGARVHDSHQNERMSVWFQRNIKIVFYVSTVDKNIGCVHWECLLKHGQRSPLCTSRDTSPKRLMLSWRWCMAMVTLTHQQLGMSPPGPASPEMQKEDRCPCFNSPDRRCLCCFDALAVFRGT